MKRCFKANARFYKAMNDASVDIMDNDIWIEDLQPFGYSSGRKPLKATGRSGNQLEFFLQLDQC